MIKIGTIKVLGSALYQWEIGRKVQIIPSPKTKVLFVQFAHLGAAETLNVEPREENGMIIADIPNILLQSGEKIAAFLVDVNESCVETTSHMVFPVIGRPRPNDYVYTETEVMTWQALEAELRRFMDDVRQELESGELKGEPGDDYVLTEEDKEEIAEMAAEMVDVPEGGGSAKPFIVTAWENHTHPIEYGADKTPQEIYQAWVEGQIIVCKYNTDGITIIELQPVAFDPEFAVFSNSAIIPAGMDSINQYFCVVINKSGVEKYETELATEEFVRNEIAALGGSGEPGTNFKTDETLSLNNGILSVNTTNQMEKDNTLPITSAGVYATVGNIEALLKTI